MDKEIEINKSNLVIILFLLAIVSILFFSFSVNAADPMGPDSITMPSNLTKNSTNSTMVNISGGYISTLNITATIQNPRWKGFVGWVSGAFTLDNPSGATLFDWTLNSITGRVYATRNGTTVTWASINCSNKTYLELENYFINHTNTNDNLSATFNVSGTHAAFSVGTKEMITNGCPTLNTYINDSRQDTYFEEMALFDGLNTVFATTINENQYGYDGHKTNSTYDFQMIVPENGLSTFVGATPYYLYVEIGS